MKSISAPVHLVIRWSAASTNQVATCAVSAPPVMLVRATLNAEISTVRCVVVLFCWPSFLLFFCQFVVGAMCYSFTFPLCIAECLTNNGGCDLLSQCVNTAGSRTCSACPVGYGGNGYTGCWDIDGRESFFISNCGLTVTFVCSVPNQQRRLRFPGPLFQHGRQFLLWRVPQRLYWTGNQLHRCQRSVL